MELIKQLICSDLQLSPQLIAINAAEGGASAKKYYNIAGIIPHRPDELFIVLQSPQNLLSDYLNINHFFQSSQIRTPRIYYQNVSKSYIIMEHCGDHSLEKLVKNTSYDLILDHYKEAINCLLAIQSCPPDAACVASTRFFDKEKFNFEFEFHLCSKLITNYFKHPLSSSDKNVLDIVFQTISHELSNQPFVFVHRDFQSSNLLLYNGRVVLTDFQDARMGLALYDLVSLLEDVYVDIPHDIKKQLLHYYIASSHHKSVPIPSENNFQWIYDLTVIQRKLHDAGAFSFCFENFGNVKYLSYIDSVVQQALDVMSRYLIFKEPFELLTMISHAFRNKK